MARTAVRTDHYHCIEYRPVQWAVGTGQCAQGAGQASKDVVTPPPAVIGNPIEEKQEAGPHRPAANVGQQDHNEAGRHQILGQILRNKAWMGYGQSLYPSLWSVYVYHPVINSHIHDKSNQTPYSLYQYAPYPLTIPTTLGTMSLLNYGQSAPVQKVALWRSGPPSAS